MAFKSIVVTHPHLVEEWDDELNIAHFASGSSKKVKWKCKTNAEHKWATTVRHRAVNGSGCPYCRGRLVLKEDSLGSKFPYLIKEWDDDRDIYTFSVHSHKKVWWKCKKGHQWESIIKNRTRNGKLGGCPYCSNQKIAKENSLGTLFPHLVPEWDDKRDIFTFAPKSSKKAMWKCEKGHRWKTSINHRTGKLSGCPYCCNRYILKENSLGSLFPHFVPEWNDERDIFSLAPNSNKKARWKCKKGHMWEMVISKRTQKEKPQNCPVCRESKLEREMAQILTDLNLNFIRQKKFEDCRGSKFPLSFDFYVLIPFKIVSYKPKAVLCVEILIEMDGEQHFRSSKHFGGEEKFKKTQRYDQIKNGYCEKNKIPLLRIRYDENVFEKFNDFISNLITEKNK